MTPKQQYYENAANTILKTFEKRGFEGCYCATKEEAAEKAMSYVKPGMSVSFGGSMTLAEVRIYRRPEGQDRHYPLRQRPGADPGGGDRNLSQGPVLRLLFYEHQRHLHGRTVGEHRRHRQRVAALIYGPKNVILVVGMNKAAATLEDAQTRVKALASPPNCIRLDRKTPLRRHRRLS